MRYRELVMDDMDDAMLSLALRDAFPTIAFSSGGRPLTAPLIDFRPTIPETGSSVVNAWIPDRDWRPKFRRDENYPRWFRLLNPPRYVIHYTRTSWFWGGWEAARWAFDLPTPEFGTIGTNYDPDEPQDRAFVNKVWNILKKLATNRMKSALAMDRVVLSRDAGGGMMWAGHHVLKWCAAEPRRMISGCRRPCDDWAPPDTPWHRDLRRRAEEMFGPDFGGAPAAPLDSGGAYDYPVISGVRIGSVPD